MAFFSFGDEAPVGFSRSGSSSLVSPGLPRALVSCSRWVQPWRLESRGPVVLSVVEVVDVLSVVAAIAALEEIGTVQ